MRGYVSGRRTDAIWTVALQRWRTIRKYASILQQLASCRHCANVVSCIVHHRISPPFRQVSPPAAAGLLAAAADADAAAVRHHGTIACCRTMTFGTYQPMTAG